MAGASTGVQGGHADRGQENPGPGVAMAQPACAGCDRCGIPAGIMNTAPVRAATDGSIPIWVLRPNGPFEVRGGGGVDTGAGAGQRRLLREKSVGHRAERVVTASPGVTTRRCAPGFPGACACAGVPGRGSYLPEAAAVRRDWLLLGQLLNDPVDHDGQQAAGCAEKKPYPCFLSHGSPFGWRDSDVFRLPCAVASETDHVVLRALNCTRSPPGSPYGTNGIRSVDVCQAGGAGRRSRWWRRRSAQFVRARGTVLGRSRMATVPGAGGTGPASSR